MTTSTLTLSQFLEQRLGDVETLAREALDAEPNWPVVANAAAGAADAAAGWHVLRHDPARVLAEVAAKRVLLDEHDLARQRMNVYNRGYDEGQLTTSNDLRLRLDANVRWRALDDAVRLLAAVYADHPDFDPAWR